MVHAIAYLGGLLVNICVFCLARIKLYFKLVSLFVCLGQFVAVCYMNERVLLFNLAYSNAIADCNENANVNCVSVVICNLQLIKGR